MVDMSKATFTFDMDDQDDRLEHLRHTKSLSMAVTLWEIRREFRAKLKHSETDDMPIEKALEIVLTHMADNDIDLDHLIE
jgi:hypothetical protein